MRSKNSFDRTDEVFREGISKKSNWLNEFADKLGLVEKASQQVKVASKTAVEVSRDRNTGPSVYEMMSAIISPTKAKFSSVEEIVVDYQKRTGLSAHLERTAQESLKMVAAKVAEAGESYEDSDDVTRVEDDGSLISESDSEKKSLNSEDSEDSEDSDSFGLKELVESLKFNMSNEEEEEGSSKKNEDDEDDEDSLPELIQRIPGIEGYIDNIIDTNGSIQIPAILHGIVESFKRDSVDQSDVSDQHMQRWISNKLISKHIDQNQGSDSSQLGRGVGTQVDYSGSTDHNDDPFLGLEPYQ